MLHQGHVLALAAMTMAVACTNSTEERADLLGPFGEAGIVFLTQSSQPVVVMEALFEGAVVADTAGCLRLAGPDAATVVWPFGFTLEDARVRDGEGRKVGEIGGRFRLGGGEVPALHPDLGMTDAVRDIAVARCPGRFWIVGDVL